MKWTQESDTCWIGHADGLRFASVIEYIPKHQVYVVDGCQMSYKTLRAAKIAAARTALSRDVI